MTGKLPKGRPVVLVTGGSRGIGRAVAIELARTGRDVVVHFERRRRAAEEVVREAGRLGARAAALGADVRSDAAVRALVQRAALWRGRLDGLVTSAGIYRGSSLAEAGEAEWREVLGVDLLGTARAVRAAAPYLERRPGAAVVTVSSILGSHASLGGVPYQAAKAGVEQLTRALALELAPGIRVNSVAPGFIRTDMNRSGHEDPVFASYVARATPLGRWGEPEEVATVVRWLLGPESAWVTGAVLGVDGGQALR